MNVYVLCQNSMCVKKEGSQYVAHNVYVCFFKFINLPHKGQVVDLSKNYKITKIDIFTKILISLLRRKFQFLKYSLNIKNAILYHRYKNSRICIKQNKI